MRHWQKVLAVGCAVSAALPLAGCRRQSSPRALVIDARNQAASAPAAAAPAAPPAPAPAVPAPAAEVDDEAAVELAGEIELPPGPAPKDRVIVYVSTGDCLNDAAPLLKRVPASDNGTFFAAVLARRGTQLSLCAAAEPGPGKPAHLYGRARAPLPIPKEQGTAAKQDPTFHDLRVPLSEGPPRSFPTQVAR